MLHIALMLHINMHTHSFDRFFSHFQLDSGRNLRMFENNITRLLFISNDGVFLFHASINIFQCQTMQQHQLNDN